MMIFAVPFLAVTVISGSIPLIGHPSDNPFRARSIFVNPLSAAVKDIPSAAESERPALARLAGNPTAIWLKPEELGTGQVGVYVKQLVEEATALDTVPVFVVYGIENRDCSGGFSSGGLPHDEYVRWVREIAAAAGDHSAVVLEPDALAASEECGKAEEMVSSLASAVNAFTDENTTTYIDAGHSNWIAPATMAARLKSVGVKKARGFSTNVSAYQSDRDEKAYAEKISRRLGGTHFVIDSGRNGNGSNGEWCNPSGRSLGTVPGFVDDNSAMDAFLWIKPPGESDGECNGGPVAGQWWRARALELVQGAGS